MNSKNFVADHAALDFSVDRELQRVSNLLKSELQGVDGLIRALQDQNPLINRLRSQYQQAKCSFREVNENNIDDLLSKFKSINQSAHNALSIDFVFLANDFPHLSRYPECHKVVSLLVDPTTPIRSRLQMAAVLQKHIEGSLSQSRKSRAGQAGEDVVEAILIASGLELGRTYSKQFKMPSGSDADFVIPAATSGSLHQVDIIIAVQISTNDRLRLTSSELKSGTIQYTATFNGFSASTKKLADIGDQIIVSQLEKGCRMICSEDALKQEISRIESRLKNRDSGQLQNRLKYFENYAKSFSEFSREIGSRYAQ